MSRAFKNYQREIRRLKRESVEDPGTGGMDVQMMLHAVDGNPAAKQWCKAKGILF